MPVSVEIAHVSTDSDGVRWYHLQVNDNGEEWVVKKRFRDFTMLDSQIAALGGLRLSLPSKGVFDKSSPAFLEDRREGLARYLTHQARQVSGLSQSPVLKQFLFRPDSGVRKPAHVEEDPGPAKNRILRASLFDTQALDARTPKRREARRDTSLAEFLEISADELPEPPGPQRSAHAFGGSPTRRNSLNNTPFLGTRPLVRLQTDVVFRLRRLIRDGDAFGARRVVDRARQLQVSGEEFDQLQEKLRALEGEGQLSLLLPPAGA